MKEITKENYINEISKYFKENPIVLEKLKKLDSEKNEIKNLKSIYGDLPKPIVITICGTPRAGKTTCIDNLSEFFKKADLKTVCLEEPAGIIYKTLKNREEKKKLLSDRIGFVEQQYEIGSKYINEKLKNNDIILCDRGILDTFIWYDMYYKQGMMDKTRYKEYLLRLKEINYLNQFYALYSDSNEAMRRDYISSLSIEPRTTMNKENIERYNASMISVLPEIEPIVESSKFIDTTNVNRIDPSITIAHDIIDNVKKLYLRK